MRFLLVVKQKRNVDAFLETLRSLVDRGHSVTLAIQERDEKTETRLTAFIDDPAFRVVTCPAVRTDEWADLASLLRRLRDCVHYLKPVMRSATKLRARIIHRLRQDLQFEASTEAVAAGLQGIPAEQVQRLDAVFAMAERGLPSDPLFDAFLRSEHPDVLLVSPLVHFGPAQADLVASARRMGIPVWMLLYSWDNLSTKGTIHRWPDRMFVWNEQQRNEAQELHGFPRDRVTVVGAPRFDAFFALGSGMNRQEFHQPLGLDPAQPTLLYVCSSRFVSDSELPFVRRWIGELRGGRSEALRACNVLVRPHPDIPLLPPDLRMTRHRWPAMPDLVARIARPFDDAQAVVLQTDFTTPQGLYESIAQSTAVVGLNTTAELESGIVGRPVFTIVADDRAVDGQSSTLHFHYLTKEHGGFVSTAVTFSEHLAQLDAALSQPADASSIRAFIESFLRPLGIDKPVAPLFAEMLERAVVDSARRTDDSCPADSDAASVENVIASRARSERPVLPLGRDDTIAISLYATPAAERLVVDGIVPTSPRTVDWLEREVGFGDVVYDVGAGIGEYVLMAVKRRGATVVAFEPGYSAYGELCDNVLLNGCEASVVPVPLALAARDGLAEIKYQQGMPGQPGYTVRDDVNWRVKHRGRNVPYLQPACLTRLDTAIEQYRLPAPNHLRLSEQVVAAQVLTGAPATLSGSALKTVCLHVASGDESSLIQALSTRGWEQRSREQAAADVQLVFVRARA